MILAAILIVQVFGLVAFGIFAYQKYMERQEIKSERQEIKKQRAEVVDLTTACGAILSAIKTRGSILELNEARKADKVSAAAEEMKAAVAAVPAKTAQEVITALTDSQNFPLKTPEQKP